VPKRLSHIEGAAMPLNLPTLVLGCLAFLIFILSGCESPPVDKDYIQSERFKKFDELRKQEYAAQVNNRESLEAYLKELIKCPKGEELTLPLQFSENHLQKSGKQCQQLVDQFNTSFDVQMLGYSQFKGTFIRWVSLENESVYKNLELLAVAHRDTILNGVQTVGTFKKNLSQNISTDIRVSQKGEFVYITSYTDRSLKYPFEYDNIIESAYKIDSLGTISKYEANLRDHKSLQKYFAAFQACESGKRFTVPFEIDMKVLLNTGSYCEPADYQFSTNFIALNVGHTTFEELNIRWILLKKESASKDQQLFTAVYRDSVLTSYQKLGIVHEDEYQDVSTAITVKEKDNLLDVTSFVTRGIKYPIRHDNTSQSSYLINARGMIKRKE